MDDKSKSQSFLKVESIRKRSYAHSVLLKENDVIVAFDNNLFFKGEKALIDDLIDQKKKNKKTLLTISRNEQLFDLIVTGSLGCDFISTDSEETEKIKQTFAKKQIWDKEELSNFFAMRDLTNNFEVIKDDKNISAGIFPPLWLAYHQKWSLLVIFSVVSFLLISVNFWVFLIGWICTSIYCYLAQKELLVSFSLLSGKAFSLVVASNNRENAEKCIRQLNPKSKFKYSNLQDPEPMISENDDNLVENKEEKNKISKTQEAIV
ncbi:MAG: hypothetical protein CMM96_07205 [Rickettsiales bacterium]|nr:hypothetical protein [Rickettsiales bacterium]